MNQLPKPGTPAFDAFMKKAAVPGSLEEGIMRGVIQEEVIEPQLRAQEMLRAKLQQMIELVPGQLFRDIELFHKKFELSPVDDLEHKLPEDLTGFRLNFMLEELNEYANAVGFQPRIVDDGDVRYVPKRYISSLPDAEKAFDGLIDLVYVALGTAYLHGFPFNDGWERVQAANMAKVRATGADDTRSTRKHSADIVKPEGWTAPVLKDLLRNGGPNGEAV